MVPDHGIIQIGIDNPAMALDEAVFYGRILHNGIRANRNIWPYRGIFEHYVLSNKTGFHYIGIFLRRGRK